MNHAVQGRKVSDQTASVSLVTKYMPLDHPQFVRVQRSIFTNKVVPDCMTHRCRILASKSKRARLDACCRYGVDVDRTEMDAILDRYDDIAPLMHEDAAEMDWFYEYDEDEDYCEGYYVRTSVHKGKCIFRSHGKRGCVIHRAALEGGWDFRGVKPHVCRLFPMTYEPDAIVMSDDYSYYSCSEDPTAPTVYQVGRADLADIFGEDLVVAMDKAERNVLGRRARMRVIASL